MTEKITLRKVAATFQTKKSNSWRHQMYELGVAISKESNNKKRDELIKIHNGYMNEYDSLKKPIIWLAVLGSCSLLVLAVLVILFGIVIIVKICLIHI